MLKRRPNDDPDKPGDTAPYSQEKLLHVSETTPAPVTTRGGLTSKPRVAGKRTHRSGPAGPSQTRSAPPLIDYSSTWHYMLLGLDKPTCMLELTTHLCDSFEQLENGPTSTRGSSFVSATTSWKLTWVDADVFSTYLDTCLVHLAQRVWTLRPPARGHPPGYFPGHAASRRRVVAGGPFEHAKSFRPRCAAAFPSIVA